ncbi:hypothetical protein BDDG_01802 [Blastomyces dermatitidis ATCC 18188]|uniref:Uncharacterized protein n=1 Tax=Ajellomyces dermatitidis (strain ATCC 18188 / CBS 674.68) TaxID=653446 RepID=F2T6Q1_AJEDA|nr:hypothetical protein BDDG_01802 [Blastomyces dermatitidis ATCC 18188]
MPGWSEPPSRYAFSQSKQPILASTSESYIKSNEATEASQPAHHVNCTPSIQRPSLKVRHSDAVRENVVVHIEYVIGERTAGSIEVGLFSGTTIIRGWLNDIWHGKSTDGQQQLSDEDIKFH